MLVDFQENITISKFQELMKTHEKIIIGFYTSWCGPCAELKKVLENLSNCEIYNDIGFYCINLANSRWLNERFSIHTVPLIFFVKTTHLIDKISGIVHKSKIVDKINQLF